MSPTRTVASQAAGTRTAARAIWSRARRERDCSSDPRGLARTGCRFDRRGHPREEDRMARPRKHDPIPRRPLGRTGVEVCAIGLGGYHLGTVGSRREAGRIAQAAVDEGIAFMDHAWEYHEGET